MVKYEYHINIHRITCNYFAIKVPSISSSANLTILSSLWTHRSTILLFLLPNKPLYQTQTERYINSILTLHRYKHYPCWAQSKPQSTQSIPPVILTSALQHQLKFFFSAGSAWGGWLTFNFWKKFLTQHFIHEIMLSYNDRNGTGLLLHWQAQMSFWRNWFWTRWDA